MQKQSGDPYRLPIEIGLVEQTGKAPRIEKIELTMTQQTFDIPADREPVEVVLDPNTWVLMQATLTKK